MKVALLGAGVMGSRIALRIAAAGHTLTVWNRSGVPDELAAHTRSTPRDAVRDVDVAIAMVTDDDASRAVWLGDDGALTGMREGALAIESSTLTPAWVRELAVLARGRGVRFVDAPVVGSRPQADQGALTVLVSGEPGDVEHARDVFAAYAGAVHLMGRSPSATVAKLAVNTLFATQVAMLGELLPAVQAQGVEPSAMMTLLAALPVSSPAAIGAGLAMIAERFEPMFPVALVAKDLRYAALDSEGRMPLTEAVRVLFERAERSGLGAENITAITKLSRIDSKDSSATTDKR